MNTTFVSMLLAACALLTSTSAVAVADPNLPEEVCSSLGKPNCAGLTESLTKAQYIDLNQDGTKELIFVFDGGSCGSQYHVYKLANNLKWISIGGWCGCEDDIYKVQTTKHNGFFDIWTCGVSGFFDGKKYTGRRQ